MPVTVTYPSYIASKETFLTTLVNIWKFNETSSLMLSVLITFPSFHDAIPYVVW